MKIIALALVAGLTFALGCGAPETSSAPPAVTVSRPVASFDATPDLDPGESAKPVGAKADKAAKAKKAKKAKKVDPLFPARKPGGWTALSPADRVAAHKLADKYVAFLDAGRTPRRAVAALVELAKKAGARALTDKARDGFRYAVEPSADAAVFFRPGTAAVSAGLQIVVVSVDAPRIELKQRPIVEKKQIGMLETKIHGDLELRSWMVHPLALDVYVQRRQGKHVSVGEAPGDPVLSIPDLLPHLSRGSQRRDREVEDPERLDALGAMSERALRRELTRRGIAPADLAITEATLVPASRARRVGVDRALVGAYGQANRVLAFAAIRELAGLSSKPPHATAVIVLGRTDAGRDGASGTPYVERALTTVIAAMSENEPDLHDIRVSLSRSAALVGSASRRARNRGLVLDATAADALPAGFRRVVDTMTAGEVVFTFDPNSSRAARDIATLDVDAITIAITSTGQGTPGELVSVYDLFQGARGCRQWLKSAR